jgi:hypothetical protein
VHGCLKSQVFVEFARSSHRFLTLDYSFHHIVAKSLIFFNEDMETLSLYQDDIFNSIVI